MVHSPCGSRSGRGAILPLALLVFFAACNQAPTSPRDEAEVPERPGLTPGATWVIGDVFAAVSNGQYEVYDNAGNFKETIGTGFGFTTGCAFNNSLTRLYTTHFSMSTVFGFADAHPHAVEQTIPSSPGNAGAESIVFDAAGNFYVGHAQGARDVEKRSPTGALLDTYDVATERVGSDWIELAADQRTLFYTSEGARVMRFDVMSKTQLTDFSPSGGSTRFALRLLPPGDGSGGLIVANGINIQRLDGSGAIVQTYDIVGHDGWFGLNLDPNGTSFWSGDINTGNIARFNIATGAVEVGPVNTGPGFTLFGVCVKGERTSAVLPPPPPPTNGLCPAPPTGGNVITGRSFFGVMVFTGTEGNDIAIGVPNRRNIFLMRGGNDFANGANLEDTFHGGTGDDTWCGGAGNDLAFGAEGSDNLTGSVGTDRNDGGHTPVPSSSVDQDTDVCFGEANFLCEQSFPDGAVVSSARFKRDLAYLLPPEWSFFGLRPVAFDYDEPFSRGAPGRRLGLVAEDVVSQYPQAVVRDANGRADAILYRSLEAQVAEEIERSITRAIEGAIEHLADQL